MSAIGTAESTEVQQQCDTDMQELKHPDNGQFTTQAATYTVIMSCDVITFGDDGACVAHAKGKNSVMSCQVLCTAGCDPLYAGDGPIVIHIVNSEVKKCGRNLLKSHSHETAFNQNQAVQVTNVVEFQFQVQL